VRFLSCFLSGSLVLAASPIAVAGNDGALPHAPVPSANRPPKFSPGPTAFPQVGNDGSFTGIVVRAGRALRVTVTAEDPDGDALVYRVVNPPEGSTFDAATGVLGWKPATTQLGKHELVFEASDGRSTVTQRASLFVQANRPPSGNGERTLFFVARARGRTNPPTQQLAHDYDSDELSFRAKNVPAGAVLRAYGSSVGIVWEPAPEASGEHELVVAVSDGELETTIVQRILVLPEWAEDDYRGWFLLGGGASGFVAHDDGEAFLGGAFDVTLVALAENGRKGFLCADGGRERDCHASHHRFYGQFELLDSLRDGEPSLFAYGFGYSASFEYYPARRFLVPHYGIELGGLVRDGLGHRVQTRPYLGLHLWADRHVWLNLALGYRVVPAELFDLGGPTASLGVVLNPW
jgi:hypothetical protein